MTMIQMHAETRTSGRKALKALRRKGFIAAELYGGGIANQSLVVSKADFLKMYPQIGESTLVDLIVDAQETYKVLIPEVARNVLTQELLHIDFRHVRMDQEIEAEIELSFSGEAPAVKILGGILVKNVESIQVRCLPTALVDSISVDLSVLHQFDEYIRIKDLVIPPGIRVMDDLQMILAMVTEPEEEEKEEAPKAMSVEDIQKVGENQSAEESAESPTEEKKTKGKGK